MYELVAFAGDKLGRKIFFDATLSMKEKAEKALRYGQLMLNALDETGDIFFAGLAEAFLGRTRGYLTYHGASEQDIATLLDMNLYAAQKIANAVRTDDAVRQAYFPERVSVSEDDFLAWIVNGLLNAQSGRHAELLKNPEYRAVLDKYR